MDLLLEGYESHDASDGSIKPMSIFSLPGKQYVLPRIYTKPTKADVIRELSAAANEVFQLQYKPSDDDPGIITLPNIRSELATITNLKLLEDLAQEDPDLLDKIMCNLPGVPIYGSQKYLSITSGILPEKIVELNLEQQKNNGPLWYDVALSHAPLQKALGTGGYFWRVDVPLSSDGEIPKDLQLEKLLENCAEINGINVTGTIPYNEKHIIPDIIDIFDTHKVTQGIVDSSSLELYKASLIGFEFIQKILKGVESVVAERYLQSLVESSNINNGPTSHLLGGYFGGGFVGRVIDE